jgi:hypothetical protein
MATVIDISTPAAPSGPTGRYVDLADIVGGALVATAISLVLFSFGSAFGLSFVSAEPGEGGSLRWLAIGGGIWIVWQAVSSAAAGGYFAGRMRRPTGDADPDEVETRDGAHGIAVWALATLVTALLAAAGVGGAARIAGATLGGAADGVADVITDSAEHLAGVALRRDAGLASEESRAEVAAVLSRALTDGEVTEADRSYLANVLATETRLTPAEARARIDDTIATAERTRDEAIEAAEQARIFTLIGAFVVAASILASGAAAYFAAVLGGRHRNENVGFARFRAAPRRPL